VQSNFVLEFILKLNPVVYTRNNDEKQRIEYGMLTVDSEGMYQQRYNDLLAPMVQAIQELKNENDALKNRLSKS